MSRRDPVRDIAIALKRLSYSDMTRLAQIFDARNDDTRNTAARFVAVADSILGPDFDINAPTTRSTP